MQEEKLSFKTKQISGNEVSDKAVKKMQALVYCIALLCLVFKNCCIFANIRAP